MPELLDSDVDQAQPVDETPPLPVRPPVLPPAVPRSASGAPLVTPPTSVQWTNAAQPQVPGTGNLQQQLSNMPIDQAAAAYSAALKFQAVRGYQDDLKSGKAPAEALAKWAPMMFTAPKEGTLAGAASMMRASQPMVRNAGGQLFRIGPTGTANPISPGRPAPVTRPSQFDLQEHKSYIDRMRAIEKELDDDPNDPEADQKRQQLRYLQTQAEGVRKRSAVAPTPQKISTKQEYDLLPSGAIYIGKNGRRYRKP